MGEARCCLNSVCLVEDLVPGSEWTGEGSNITMMGRGLESQEEGRWANIFCALVSSWAHLRVSGGAGLLSMLSQLLGHCGLR